MASSVKKERALDIKKVMSAFDSKKRNFIESLSEEERKEFSSYMMIRWGATVQGIPELEEYYLVSCNEKLNKNFFDISTSKHDKLQWLSATTISPGMGNQYHPWIPLKTRKGDSKTVKFLRQFYPMMKDDELELMAELNSKDGLKKLAIKHGWEEKDIKKEL